MEMNLGFCIFFISFTKFLLPTLSSTNSTDRIRWCNKTPDPRLGPYHLRQQYHNSATMNRHEFRNLAVEVAMNQALDALSHMKWLEPKCHNKRGKAAWKDCLELYESTILQLNQTLDDTNKHTDDDVQTWLSAALTNLDTCRTGFIELGVTKNILPLISNNVSERISNILAINAPFVEQRTYINEFPSSLPTWDRRISQLGETKRSKPDVVVAKDGSGNFSTVKEALLHIFAKRSERKRLVIFVKNGVYDEHVEVSNGMKNVMMIGDGINKTIVTGNHSNRQGFTTLGSATFVVLGKGFVACGITFRNTAGPENGQAVALVSRSDLSVFYQCSFDGYQDTLYVHSNRQFYKECHIYGTVDFIFGNAAIVFQNCVVYSRARKHGENVVTAQGRTDPNEKTGISIHNSRVVTSRKTFLGRPWQEYSRTVYLQTYLDTLVDPVGWLEWKSDVKNLYYGEYKNNGPGSSTKRRVKWGGYRVMKDRAEAENFTVANFIGGESLLPNTGVPFTSNL